MKVNIRNSRRKHIKMCGFRKRMQTKGGRAVLARRRAKGKRKLTTA